MINEADLEHFNKDFSKRVYFLYEYMDKYLPEERLGSQRRDEWADTEEEVEGVHGRGRVVTCRGEIIIIIMIIIIIIIIKLINTIIILML